MHGMEWQAEYRRKWEDFERQERLRLKRGIGAPQVFRHPYIEDTMWKEDTSSSEDPESDEVEGDDDRGDEDTARTQKRVSK
jgi:hypothetical protein